MIRLILLFMLFAFCSLVDCELELCEKSLDYLIKSEKLSLISNSSTNKWNELNSLLSNDLNKCVSIGFDNEFNLADQIVKFNISFCKLDYHPDLAINRHYVYSSSNKTNQQNDNQSIFIDFCLPTTCSRNDLRKIDDFYLDKLLNQFDKLIYDFGNRSNDYPDLRDLVRRESTHFECTHEDQLSGSKWHFYAFIGFSFFLFLIIIISTTTDYLRKSLSKVESVVLLSQIDDESNYQAINESRNRLNQFNCRKFVDTFSILSSINRLISVDQNVSINSIYGLKVLSIFSIIIGHTYIYSASIADNYLTFKDQVTGEIIFRIVLNCSFAVDTFFTSSGLLLSYLLFKRNLIKNDFWEFRNISKFYFNR